MEPQSNVDISSKPKGYRWRIPKSNRKNLQPFQKHFYSESEDTQSMNTSMVNEWMTEHAIEAFVGYHDNMASSKKASKNVPKPVIAFEDAGFSGIVMAAIRNAHFVAPTPIQAITWPMLSSGCNVIGIARTGSGKTLAFLLPAIAHINAQPKVQRGDGPIALFIAPTRELACQIAEEVGKFTCKMRFAAVYGGAKPRNQQNKLEAGVEIVIATPGRLLDFAERSVTNFDRVTYCVIDEADRLLDMGFQPQLNAILDNIRPDRQLCMFSATWPKSVRQLAKKYLLQNNDDSNVFQVAVGTFDNLHACKDVKQEFKFVEDRNPKPKHMHRSKKIKELKEAIDEQLNDNAKSRILVFLSTKKRTNKARDILVEAGYSATCMHGNKSQNARDTALKEFKDGTMQIMLATNVAARGIHVDDIHLVINFDFPDQIEEYVHRIGRTGRAKNKGKALSFFIPESDGWMADSLIQILRDAKQKVPKKLFKYQGVKKPKGPGLYGGRHGQQKNKKSLFRKMDVNAHSTLKQKKRKLSAINKIELLAMDVDDN